MPFRWARIPLAILRTGNLGVATLIRKQTGVQTIIHQTGRDLNALGLQSRMMEAHLLGIEAVLAVSGDSASATDQPGVTGVFDLRSYGLLRMLRNLNNGLNLAGRSIKQRTNFSVGAAFSFRPESPRVQIQRLEKKADLGARFAMTQPLFTREAVEEMIEKTSHIDMLIFPGIFPVISARNAEFLHNEVPGITVPRELRRTLASYEQVADQRKAALEYTRELVESIAPVVDGLYFVSPLNKWEIALEFVRQVRIGGWTGQRPGRSDIVHNSPADFYYFNRRQSCQRIFLPLNPFPKAIPTRWPTRFPTRCLTPFSRRTTQARVACESLVTTGLALDCRRNYHHGLG